MTTNELITEIEEAVRREKLEKTAKEYGPYVLAGCLLAILITGLTAGWKSWQMRTNAAHTAIIMQAAESAAPAQAMAESAARLGAGPATMARLSAAGMYLQDGNKAEALAQFRLAADDKRAPALLRDMATLQAVRLEWDMGGENVKAEELLKRLAPLTNDDDNAWQSHARLQAAVIAAHGLNDFAGARKYLAPVLGRADEIPASLLQRAKALDHVYGLKEQAAQGKDKAAPATQG